MDEGYNRDPVIREIVLVRNELDRIHQQLNRLSSVYDRSRGPNHQPMPRTPGRSRNNPPEKSGTRSPRPQAQRRPPQETRQRPQPPSCRTPVNSPRRTPPGPRLSEFGLFIPILLLLSLVIGRAAAVIGYDCSGERLNVTTISLTEVGGCNDFTTDVSVTPQLVHLIQLAEYDKAHVMHYKVIVDRTVRYCGAMHRNYDVAYGYRTYVYEMSREACQALHRFNRTNLWGIDSGLITPNSTNYVEFNMGGWTSPDGYCGGVDFTDAYGQWKSVYVRAKVQIIVRDYYASVQLDSGRVILETGTQCNLKDGHCTDATHGDTYYDPSPQTDCTSHYRTIRITEANKTISTDHNKVVYVASMKEISFALTRGRAVDICGKRVFRTDHPKLFISEIDPTDSLKLNLKRVTEEDIDIATYLNSKLVHLNYHWERQMTIMYSNILKKECELERKVLEQALVLATVAPDEMAKAIMKEPGYMAVIAGEVAHLVKCVPVEVTIRHVDECYQELAVSKGNDSYFLSPRTKILRTIGTQIP